MTTYSNTHTREQPEESSKTGVYLLPGGQWGVFLDGTLRASRPGHSSAWKLLDRLQGEVTSPAEKRNDYHFQQSLKETFG